MHGEYIINTAQTRREYKLANVIRTVFYPHEGEVNYLYTVIGVRFKKAGKIYYFDPGSFRVSKDNHVIVETARGVEYGHVVIGPREVGEQDVVLPLKKVIRMANAQDAAGVEQNLEMAKKAISVCEAKVEYHKLKMKLVDAEYTFDRNKVIFYFISDGRIDFRELVKDLASALKTRIEMRQIGVRDQAKILGGLGPCGRPLCCSTFLGDFMPVSIKMAKDQNLSLNPTKISGLCGRLMCCLKYEHDHYEAKKSSLPKVGARVVTSLGEGRVTNLDMQERFTQVKMRETGKIERFEIDEVAEMETV
jgi:cell fate regulator YaaT (PSP1 superfamily)